MIRFWEINIAKLGFSEGVYHENYQEITECDYTHYLIIGHYSGEVIGAVAEKLGNRMFLQRNR